MSYDEDKNRENKKQEFLPDILKKKNGKVAKYKAEKTMATNLRNFIMVLINMINVEFILI